MTKIFPSGLMFISFCLLLVGKSGAAVPALTDQGILEPVPYTLPFTPGETLHYKLSYRGLLTSMIWADIADADMSFKADVINHDHSPGYQFILYISTENYKKSELIHALRYTYKVNLDHQLQRALLIEEQDTGVSQAHEILWLDWINKNLELYKKREKKIIYSGLLWKDQTEKWEDDGNQPLPDFLSSRSVSAVSAGITTGERTQGNNSDTPGNTGLSYFIHKKSGDEIRYEQIFDPLSLIYKLRQAEFMTTKIARIPVALGDDIRIYRVESLGMEQIEVDSSLAPVMLRPAIKYFIHTDRNRNKAFYVWLSDDSKRIPLKFMMQAPLGKLVVVLQE